MQIHIPKPLTYRKKRCNFPKKKMRINLIKSEDPTKDEFYIFLCSLEWIYLNMRELFLGD